MLPLSSVGNKDKKNICESKSLWNYALSPGWTQQEVEVLKIGLMKFGIGKWTAMEKSGILPTKSIQQCYLQTQRIIGQQSLAEFMNLHVDIDRIAIDNRRKQGIRKMGFLVNQGGKLTPEEKAQLQAMNHGKYGLTPEQVEQIKLPPPCSVEIYDIDKIVHPKSKLSTIEKINHFMKLEDALLAKLDMIKSKRTMKQGLVAGANAQQQMQIDNAHHNMQAMIKQQLESTLMTKEEDLKEDTLTENTQMDVKQENIKDIRSNAELSDNTESEKEKMPQKPKRMAKTKRIQKSKQD
ncbi:UNKNOWN [Stylonychia lemnae]|uniref:Myb-like domain-containing protein n=1 Tax=Stylonychia lemnae TaxID=5949 RepID=A0A078AHS6_STYLE|nr:UNKNOWN [Stylonychia lemnae]|eukprot:CDW81052.1 UNKNOWN [Stylonychia lemnae]